MNPELNPENDDMRPEYDFRGGVRGKHYRAYRQGHTVTIHKMDGTTVVQHFKLEEGAVILDPDVRLYFPNDEAVNKALRSLIAPGIHHFKRGAFLTRHGLSPEQVTLVKIRLLSIPDELVQRATFLAKLHRQANVEAWLTRIIQERVELEEVVLADLKHLPL